MIKKFVDRFMAGKDELRAKLSSDEKHAYMGYEELVKLVIETITSSDYGDIDPERIHAINDGDYQGTLVFVIASTRHQPSTYWSVMVDYGSCSGCDTLQRIQGFGDNKLPTSEQVDDYMNLCLHIVQGLCEMNKEEE